MSRDDAWAPGWAAERLEKLDEVVKCSPTEGACVRVVRKAPLPEVCIACVSVDLLEVSVVDDLAKECNGFCFILNVPSAARLTGDAISAAGAVGAAVGGMGDAMRALRSADPSSYRHKDWEFVERGFAQHSAVDRFELLDRGRYLLERGGRAPLVVAVINDYEVTADSVRRAIDMYPKVDVIVTSNPNALTISDQARAAASSADADVALWRDFYGSLRS